MQTYSFLQASSECTCPGVSTLGSPSPGLSKHSETASQGPRPQSGHMVTVRPRPIDGLVSQGMREPGERAQVTTTSAPWQCVLGQPRGAGPSTLGSPIPPSACLLTPNAGSLWVRPQVPRTLPCQGPYLDPWGGSGKTGHHLQISSCSPEQQTRLGSQDLRFCGRVKLRVDIHSIHTEFTQNPHRTSSQLATNHSKLLDTESMQRASQVPGTGETPKHLSQRLRGQWATAREQQC